MSTERIRPWSRADLPVLEHALGDPAMTAHLGGPESAEKIAKRQARYEVEGSGQFAIVDVASGEAAGWVGYWEREWRDAEVYEVGWAVLPAFQGRGVAGRATALLLDVIRAEGSRRFVHAYPSVENAPSNGICRKLGFVLVAACNVEYPPGNVMRCNDWRFDLETQAVLSPTGHATPVPPSPQ